MDDVTLDPFVQRWSLVRNQVCLPRTQVVPKLEVDECVVFNGFNTVELPFPMEDIVEKILDVYNIEMHIFPM